VEGDRLARKDRPIRYGVLRSNGGVALMIDSDDALGLRMAPGETIPFDHVLAGQLRRRRAPTGRSGGQAGRPRRRGTRLQPPRLRAGRTRRPQAAVIVLQVNTGLYPDSANAWDSLGEVLLQDGQRARALECYRKVLEVLPRDKQANEALKRQLQATAERQIGELSAEPRPSPPR
jgi:tetratricopeptide (TPR) repeat protein